MSKKYINNISDKDIAWFNLDNYQYIEEQSEHEVIMEFDVRKSILLGSHSDVAAGSFRHIKLAMKLDDEHLLWLFTNEIFAGNPSFILHVKELDHTDEKAKKFLHDKYPKEVNHSVYSLIDALSRYQKVDTNKVWLTSVGNVIGFYDFIELEGLVDENLDEINNEILGLKSQNFESDEDEFNAFSELGFKKAEGIAGMLESFKLPFSVASKSDYALCNVDLAGFSDAELITHFQKSLVEWREILGVPEPERKVSTPGVIGKLKEFRIIPLLDLIAWELKNDVKIKKSILAGLLFPDNENGNSELESGKGKIMKFLNKVMAPNFDFKDK